MTKQGEILFYAGIVERKSETSEYQRVYDLADYDISVSLQKANAEIARLKIEKYSGYFTAKTDTANLDSGKLKIEAAITINGDNVIAIASNTVLLASSPLGRNVGGYDEDRLEGETLGVLLDSGEYSYRIRMVQSSSVCDNCCFDNAEDVLIFDTGKIIVGLSAYEVAVKNGYKGTEKEWLEDLALSYSELTDEQISGLMKPATDAATKAYAAIYDTEKATESANTATSNANIAADSAIDSASAANDAADLATLATKSANATIELSKDATDSAIVATTSANTATKKATDAASSALAAAAEAFANASAANDAAESANTATSNANIATKNVNTAISGANTAASAAASAATGATTAATAANKSAARAEAAVDSMEAALDEKVDKVVGQGLSTNDYTTAEKTKLAGIEAGAEVNDTDVVKFTVQELTSEQQEQVRNNIDAIPDAPNDGKKYVRSDGEWVEADAKIDLFIDLWNNACGNWGTYNTTTGHFELNGITDLTYEDALNVYQYGNISAGISISTGCNSLIRTNIPYRGVTWSTTKLQNEFFCKAANIEVIRLFTQNVYLAPQTYALSNLLKLKYVYGVLTLSPNYIAAIYQPFLYCPLLEEVSLNRLAKDFNLSQSPNLSAASILYMITNSVATTAISITLHEDAYARAMADSEIQSALEDKTLITLTSV